MRVVLIAVLVVAGLSLLLPARLAGAAEADSTASSSMTATAPEAWRFEVAPYFMAASMAGDIGIGGFQTEASISFKNILDNLDFGAMGYASAGKGDWSLMLDAIYMKLKKSGDLGPFPVTGELEQTVVEGMVAYRVPTEANVNVYAGVRYYDVSFKASVNDTTRRERSQSWADPIVGVRARWDFGPKPTGWSILFVGDVGGFGIGSKISYQVFPAGGYRFSRVVSAFLGYRYIYVDYQNEDDQFLYDMGTGGPLLGVAFSF